MLKEFVFVVIIISTYLTWHSTFLFKGKADLSSNALLAADKNKDKGEDTDMDEDRNEDEDPEQNQVKDTCSALGNCLCALSLCFFAPCTSSCCSLVRGEN